MFDKSLHLLEEASGGAVPAGGFFFYVIKYKETVSKY